MTRISSDPADDKTTEYTWDYRNRLTQVTEKNNAGVLDANTLPVCEVKSPRRHPTAPLDGPSQSGRDCDQSPWPSP
jgi:hypothetical protein